MSSKSRLDFLLYFPKSVQSTSVCAWAGGCSGSLRRSGGLLAQRPAPQGPGERAPGAGR